MSSENYDENKELSYLQYWDVNDLFGSAMPQKLPVENSKWIKDISKVDEKFIKGSCKESNKIIFSWRWCSISWKLL